MKFMIETDYVKGNFKFSEIAISPNEENGYRPFELFVSSLGWMQWSITAEYSIKKKDSLSETSNGSTIGKKFRTSKSD